MLNQRRQTFVNEYLISGNATDAAIKAGYSRNTARSIGQQLLTFPDIQQALQEHRKQAEQRTAVTLDRVVKELAKIAFFEIGEALDLEDNELRIKNLSDLSADVRAAISEVTETDTAFGKRRSIKLHSKLTALDALMKHLGGYITVNELIDKMGEKELDELITKIMAKK
jgi:phage terminase small subunit